MEAWTAVTATGMVPSARRGHSAVMDFHQADGSTDGQGRTDGGPTALESAQSTGQGSVRCVRALGASGI